MDYLKTTPRFPIYCKNQLSYFLIGFVFLLFPILSSAQYSKLLDMGSVANGANPTSTPITDGTYLYGTTYNGGVNNLGTIYKIKLDGTGYQKLFDFDNTHGSFPVGSLFSDGTFLYGMTSAGGAGNQGVAYKIKPDGTGFSNLLDFNYATTGGFPFGSFISDGTFLYGMTSQGGASGYGTIFKIKTDGTTYTNLLNFNYVNGSNPHGTLYTDGTFLYGTTSGGTSNNGGSIFKIKTDGTNYTLLYSFSGSNGTTPRSSLISDGTFLYGMTYTGGTNNDGVIFKIMPDGSNYSTILNFDYSVSNGANPKGSLTFDGTYLYGMTTQGFSNGTIFKIKPDGSGFTNLLNMDVNTLGYAPEGTLLLIGPSLYGVRSGQTIYSQGISYLGTIFKINTDGSSYTKLLNYEATGNTPSGSLISDGTFLYGLTYAGGQYNYGTVFKMKPDGTAYTKLIDLDGAIIGRNPYGSLFFDGTFLYGMTSAGGANDMGVIFKVKQDGSGATKLLDFDGANNGSDARGSLISDGTFLYGMTPNGGANDNGTLFKILPNGSGYLKLFDFNYSTQGARPRGSLLFTAGALYGVTSEGGSNSVGSLFKINTDGTGFNLLYNFDLASGSTPQASLLYDGTFLYGTTTYGGSYSLGTVYKIKPDGTGYTTLFNFNGFSGSNPTGTLTTDGTYLYGTTTAGGLLSNGTIFKIKTDGTTPIKLLDLESPSSDGLLSDGTFLYGMTQSGGVNNLGDVYKITLSSFVSVSNFSPTDGVVGTYVTINGIGFNSTPASNSVKFNGLPAHVVSATDTTLIAIVPAGATNGSISVATGTVATSLNNFIVDTVAVMVNVTVQNCNVKLLPPTYDYIRNTGYMATETFVPVNPSDKVKISFSSIDLQSDALSVYNGPTSSSPLITKLQNTQLPTTIVATGSGGELTFVYTWGDGTTDWQATISCVASGPAPVIASQSLATQIGGKITLDLKPLITTPNLNLASLQVMLPPSSGAVASIDTNGILTIDYSGKPFTGMEQITIQACDQNSQCSTQVFTIDVVSDIIIYNGVSPYGANPKFLIQYIELLQDTQVNTVSIYDRWENLVWHANNYNNDSVVFTGSGDSGSSLPTGVYFYKIDFASGKKSKTGFISLRRP